MESIPARAIFLRGKVSMPEHIVDTGASTRPLPKMIQLFFEDDFVRHGHLFIDKYLKD